MNLDSHQRAVVDSDAPFLQVVGLPGTGKTWVLAHRIARLMEGGVAPESIVVLTFTNSACASLRRSIALKVGTEKAGLAERVRISTFHSFSRELIERFPEDVGLTSEWALMDFLDAHNVLHYPKAAGLVNRTQSGGGSGSSSSESGTVAAAAASAAAARELQSEQSRSILKVFKTYSFEQALAFGKKIATRRELGLEHLFIDEFQDTTVAQFQLVDAIVAAQPGVRLTVAGDPNQEIFGFQADRLPQAMAHMLEVYPQTEVMYLKYNYRSTPQIIDTFQQIAGSPPVTLVPTLPRGLEPTLTIFDRPAEELEGVLALIKDLTARGYNAGDIAVLVRQNSQAQAVAQYLCDHGLPAKHEMSVRVLGLRQMTSVAITLMKWSLTPKDFYLIQLLYNRYHQFVRRGDFAQLLQLVRSSSSSSGGSQPGGARPLADALLELYGERYNHRFLTHFLPQTRERLLASETRDALISALEDAIRRWKPAAGSRARPGAAPSEEAAWSSFVSTLKQCDNSIESTPILTGAWSGGTVGTAGTAGIDTAVAVTGEGSVPRGAWLEILLKHLFSREKTLNAPDADAAAVATATGPAAAANDARFVEVSTIHAAKSHEWPVVIVPSVRQRSYPLAGSQEVERRIAYVAASRAREVLHFTNIGPVRPGSLSSFLKTETDLTSTMKLLTVEEAVRRDPLVFKPIKAIRRVSRLVKL